QVQAGSAVADSEPATGARGRSRKIIWETMTISRAWPIKLRRDSRSSRKFSSLIQLSFGCYARSQTMNCAPLRQRTAGESCGELEDGRSSFITTPGRVRRPSESAEATLYLNAV